MIFKFSEQKSNLLDNINNKFNKTQNRSNNSYRVGVLPNINYIQEYSEEHKKINFWDKIDKIDDYNPDNMVHAVIYIQKKIILLQI